MREQILIMARPSRLREALRALIATLPQLEIVGQVEERVAALKMVQERQPGLLLLDSSLPDNEVEATIEQIKLERSETYCIVLAHSERQQAALKSAGADEVLLKGFSTATLLAVIERVMSQPEAAYSRD